MRRKKHKQTKRAVQFYKINFGFRPPYKVLLDGNFVKAVDSLKRGDCKQEISKLLGDQARVFTTKCVMHELRGLGKEFADTRQSCKRYALHQCGHEHPVSAGDCLTGQIEGGNTEHFFIATQDRTLQRKIMALPGGAVIYASVNGVHLDSPSEGQRKHALAKAAGIPSADLQRLKKKSEDSEDSSDEEGRRIGSGQQADRPVFRRHKAKGPNPLSMRKKQKKVEDTANGKKEDGGEQPKAKRQRRRRPSGDDGGGTSD